MKNLNKRYNRHAQTVATRKRPGPPSQPRCIFVDVDGTLFSHGQLNENLAQWCREKRAEGFEMVLWSSRGREYAKRSVEEAGLSDVFDSVVSKPRAVVDDQGWEWIQYTQVVQDLHGAFRMD